MSFSVKCDLCGSSDASVLFQARDRRFGLPGNFAVVRCGCCRLVRTEPQPERLDAFYPRNRYYSYAPPTPPSPRARARVREAYGLDGRDLAARLGRGRLLPGLPPGPPGEILDVGCGSGEMLLALREAGWSCHGVEVDPGAVSAARAAGLADVHAGDLLELDYPPASFDAIRFWHVLEHVRSPRAQLAAAQSLLRPGGTLTIGVPNFGSLIARVARERSFYLDVPRHLWHFDRRTLGRLVREVGFDVTRLRLMTASAPILGTLAYLRGRSEPSASRAAWFAALPLATILDALRLGDALELYAIRRER